MGNALVGIEEWVVVSVFGAVVKGEPGLGLFDKGAIMLFNIPLDPGTPLPLPIALEAGARGRPRPFPDSETGVRER